MRVLINCIDCGLAGTGVMGLATAEVEEDGVYFLECANGHRTASVVQVLHFELLFESAALALHDGYYREAVASFAAALERFFEFYVRVVCAANEIPGEELKTFWRAPLNRSEPQSGAFALAHLLQTRKAHTFADPEFRNSVIHRGHFPTRERTYEFGKGVYDTIIRLMDELHNSVPTAFTDEYVRAHQKRFEEARSSPKHSSLALPTCLDVLGRGNPRLTFEQVMARVNASNPMGFHRGGRE